VTAGRVPYTKNVRGTLPFSPGLSMVSLPASLAGLPWTELAVLMIAFIWGATVGSFVNVVAHRVPRGESVVTGASRCPTCGVPIRPRDNVPVVGWLLLRGRCRSCHAPISTRYLAGELFCGGITATVAAVELIAGGSLPWLSTLGGQPIDRVLMLHDLRPLAAWALHSAILILLTAWSLLGGSGRAGRTTTWIAFGVVVGTVVALPTVGPPGIAPDGSRWPADPASGSLTAALTGAATGLLLARATRPALDGGGLAVLGAAVGWQTMTVVAIVTLLARSSARRFHRWPAPTIDPLPAVATATFVFWRPIRTAFMLAWPWDWGN